ncbi:TPR-like protein [Coemansia reversa NRRL 1564]|uniref:TPR-like protein n=1 Tax=Coemansia reversa (strain ATCC 12441 / NRRL 1564) TaxID=763665 RepID=A0A2G5BBA4_COERN|nr:TPR-like protein [Coemansia reversa NRRL 1564]|eukprot:PIA15997.1 TPR-like protein [Coemansia reversa NRRL 1564]
MATQPQRMRSLALSAYLRRNTALSIAVSAGFSVASASASATVAVSSEAGIEIGDAECVVWLSWLAGCFNDLFVDRLVGRFVGCAATALLASGILCNFGAPSTTENIIECKKEKVIKEIEYYLTARIIKSRILSSNLTAVRTLKGTQYQITRQHLTFDHVLKVNQATRYYASDAGFSTTNPALFESQKAMALGASALTQGNADLALGHLIRALELHPTADVHYNMGICQYMLKDMDKALDHWKKSVKMDPLQADVYVSLGNVYFMSKNDPDMAINYMKQALELSPTDPEIQFNLACMYESKNDIESAIKLYDQAVSHGLEKAKVHLRNAMAKKMKNAI